MESRGDVVTCCIYQRVVDDSSGRTVEQLVAELDRDYSPAAALSAFFADEEPPSGTYSAECRIGERLHTATVTYDSRTVAR